jgi:hypothetical protein
MPTDPASELVRALLESASRATQAIGGKAGSEDSAPNLPMTAQQPGEAKSRAARRPR